MDDAPRPRSRWKAPLLIVLSLLLCTGGTALWIDAGANAKWERMRARVAELRKEVDDRVRNRPSLADDPIPGNAWEDCRAVHEAFAAAERSFPDTPSLSDRNNLPEPPIVLRLLDEHPEILDGMRRCIRRTSLTTRASRPSMRECWNACILVLRAAEVHYRAGRLSQGLDHIIVSLLFARDFAFIFEVGPAFLQYLYAAAQDHIHRVLEKCPSDADLAILEKRLKALDDHCPISDVSYKAWVARTGDRFLGWPSEIPGRDMRLRKYVWNARIALSSVFEQQDEFAALTLARQTLDWAAARTHFENAITRLASDEPAVTWLQVTAKDWIEVNLNERKPHSRLRILRTATAYCRTGTLSPLPDPYGDMLRTAQTGGKTFIWSVGPDGVDARGTGDDLLLELNR